MSEALRMAVVRLATDPGAYEDLIRDPHRALACVPTAERQLLEAGDSAGLASALGPLPVHPAAPVWPPGWSPAFVWSTARTTAWTAHAPWFPAAPAAWPASYRQLPGWPLP